MVLATRRRIGRGLGVDHDERARAVLQRCVRTRVIGGHADTVDSQLDWTGKGERDRRTGRDVLQNCAGHVDAVTIRVREAQRAGSRRVAVT